MCISPLRGKKKRQNIVGSRGGSAVQVLSPPGPAIHTWCSRDCFIWSPGVPAHVGGRGKRSACSGGGQAKPALMDAQTFT